jgi:hypothetical protein
MNPHLFQAIVLKSGLGLLAQGIKPNRAWTLKATLATAGRITGKTYPVSKASCEKARADLQAWIDAGGVPVANEESKA